MQGQTVVYLPTLQVSRYCLLSLQSSMDTTDTPITAGTLRANTGLKLEKRYRYEPDLKPTHCHHSPVWIGCWQAILEDLGRARQEQPGVKWKVSCPVIIVG